MCRIDLNLLLKTCAVHHCLRRFVILIFCLICVSGSISLAQSGRKQTEAEAKTAQLSGRNEQKDRQATPEFIVITAPPDFTPDNAFFSGNSQSQNFEYLARRGCQLVLKALPEAKVIEDENLERWEARETAATEDNAWVIWMELKWEPLNQAFPTSFRLRYLLFEPGTGKLAASGIGKGTKQTWGQPRRNMTLQEQVEEAGRNIADQVLSEISK